MAESKKTSGGTKKTAHQTRNEAAEALRQAAELIASLNSEASTETTTKKPAAKKTAAKSGASKPPAKKSTTKKPTTKAAPKKSEQAPVEEAKEPSAAEEPKTETPVEAAPQKRFGNRRSDCMNCGAENDKNAVVCAVCGAKLRPLPNAGSQEQAQPASEPVVEQKAEQPVPAPAPEPAVEEKAEEKTEQPTETVVEQKVEQTEQPTERVVEQKSEQPAPAQKRGKKSDAFLNKSKDFIDNKGKFPLFIVANALLFLSFLFLLIFSFDIPNATNGVAVNGNLFKYFGNKASIVLYWQATAGEWASGGYVMMGILMTLACLVPLALVVKNVVLLVLKNDKNVHMLDAVITFAFLIAYLGVVNMYGANMTWAHILVLVMSIVLLAYTIFVILLENREGQFPFFSIANLVLVLLCMFLLTSNKIYAAPGWYAAHAAAFSGGGGFAFIMLLVALAALVLLVVMQVKKLPEKIAWLFEFIVPAVAGVCALIALISFVTGKPAGIGIGGGFVFGAVLTVLFAAADVVFALVKPLRKFNVKVTDRMVAVQPAPATQPAEAASAPATETEAAPAVEQPAPATEKPVAEAPAENGGKVYCSACGTQNQADDMYCIRCGRKLR